MLKFYKEYINRPSLNCVINVGYGELLFKSVLFMIKKISKFLDVNIDNDESVEPIANFPSLRNFKQVKK